MDFFTKESNPSTQSFVLSKSPSVRTTAPVFGSGQTKTDILDPERNTFKSLQPSTLETKQQPQRKHIISSLLEKKKERNHITIQMCSFKEAFLKTSPRHIALCSSWLWQEMINNKRGLTSLEGDIILRTDIAL